MGDLGDSPPHGLAGTVGLLPGPRLFWGTFVHSKTLAELEILHNTVVCVDATGKIVAVQADCQDLERIKADLLAKLGWDESDVTVQACKDGQFFFPGFIGSHSSQTFTGTAP